MARILFVDDDPFTLETLNKSVQLFGHQAVLATNGEQALRLAKECSPDLIMTDMMLPDMDGLNLVTSLRKDPSTSCIPIVMLTASPEIDALQLSRAAGVDAYLNKPIHLQQLQEVIQKYTTS